MKRESRLSGVKVFFRPDKEEPLSIDADTDPNLKLLVTEGERPEGDDTFESTFLRLLQPLGLSTEDVVNLLKEETVDGFTSGFRVKSASVLSDLDDNRDTGDDVNVSERATAEGAFGITEGSNGSLLSRLLLFPCSETEEAFFLPSIDVPFWI